MRTMEIPRFPRKVAITDLENLYKTRLKQKPERSAEIAVPLLGYMGWPNDPAAREQATEAMRVWLEGGEPQEFLRKLPLLHRNWGRIADIIQLHHALTEGEHQRRRGGASVGKAIYLGAQRIEARGTGSAKLWEGWSKYKDAGHLIAAVIAVSADMQQRNRQKPLSVGFQDLLPIRVVCLVPELVIGVALHYQEYGLNCVSMGAAEPMFDAETLWRIPENIGVEPAPPPSREVLSAEIAILNSRRAGNRGRAARLLKTTPVF